MKSISLSSSLSLRLIAAAMLAMTVTAWHAGAHAQPAARSSVEQGVTLKVTPQSPPAGAGEWEFSVVLDTHSQALDDDLAKNAVLVIEGQEVAPLRWTGTAPGGHHREGRLVFPAPASSPATVELRIQRPGEAAARLFRWDAAALK